MSKCLEYAEVFILINSLSQRIIADVLSSDETISLTNPIAKPRRDIIRKFGTGDLLLSPSTIDFMMFLNPYVDKDFRINIDLSFAAKQIIGMQKKTFHLVLNELKENQLIVSKGKETYSRFHVLIDGQETNFEYLKILNAYTSDKVQGYSLRLKRLFYYFVTAQHMEQFKKIHIENLYDNKVHTKDVGVSYFDNFKEVFAALLVLIKDGFIEIRLGATAKDIITSESKQIEQRLSSFFKCNLNTKKRKQRTSYTNSINSVISVRVSNKTFSKIVAVEASKAEFIKLANDKYVCWEDLNPLTIDYITGYKNDLYNLIGDNGISIYRKALKEFINDHADSLLHFDIQNKVANYFMDFYLLKEIQNILIGAAHQQRMVLTPYSSSYNKGDEIKISNYAFSNKDIGKLLSFFTNKGSMNHKVIFDGMMLKERIDYSLLEVVNPAWIVLKNEVEFEYKKQHIKFHGAVDIKIPELINNSEWRSFMILCAEKGLFVKAVEFEEFLKQKRMMIENSIRKPIKPIKFYNWLVERD